jgi:hypothetical protein
LTGIPGLPLGVPYGSRVSGPRPAPIRQPALPPWDAADVGGGVPTTPPPELLAALSDPLYLRADFDGVCLGGGSIGNAGNAPVNAAIEAACIARWGSLPPMLNGANGTPVPMLMTPMLGLYPRTWQDAALTEHAERGYQDIVVSYWNDQANGVTTTPAMLVQWAQYVKSWGFRVAFWQGALTLNDPFLAALVDAHALDWYLPGEEIDQQPGMNPAQLETVLDNALAGAANGIPVLGHFSTGSRGGYPLGFPLDTYLTDWSKYDGKVHLALQLDQTRSAGTEDAVLGVYTRPRVHLGQLGGNGQLALNSKVFIWEYGATAELYGTWTEAYTSLRVLEALYDVRTDSRIPALGGFANGARWPSGWPLLPQYAPGGVAAAVDAVTKAVPTVAAVSRVMPVTAPSSPVLQVARAARIAAMVR